jgi:hypothetical protein
LASSQISKDDVSMDQREVNLESLYALSRYYNVVVIDLKWKMTMWCHRPQKGYWLCLFLVVFFGSLGT